MNNFISIVIPTFKRKESLLRLMRSLISENIYELIVVEQVENNKEIFEKTAKKFKLSFKYLFLSKSSIARAMNYGVKRAKGKYILFLDDDVIVRKGLLQAYSDSFIDSRVAATVGRTITRGQNDEENRKDTGRITWLGDFTDGFSSGIRQEVDTVIGCNTCWRKDIYNDLGGIDEQFTGNAMRLESDLSLRVKNKGYKIVFVPTAVVDHYREEKGGARKIEGRLQWYFDFFSNEVYFFLKHRSSWLLPIFLVKKTVWALRCMFGFGREVSIRSICTPFGGIIDGIQKYRIYLQTL